MLPIKLTIMGFGPHENTVIDFTDLRSPVAFVAPYGTGKTFLMEGAFACLYGRFGWYAGSIYDALTQGGSGEGRIVLTFEHAGIIYTAQRIVRDTGKTRTQSATLSVRDETIAGPKVSDFDRSIETLIGSYELACSTWLLTQNRLLDLCGQPGESELVARRRSTFNELIGAGELDAVCERAGEECRVLERQAKDLEAQLAGDPDFEFEISQANIQLGEIETRAQVTRDNIRDTSVDLEAAKTRLRDSEAGDDVLTAQISEHERAVARVREIEGQRSALLGEIQVLDARAQGMAVYRDELERLEQLSTKRKGLIVLQEAYVRWREWSFRHHASSESVDRYQSTLDALNSIPGVDDATRELASRLDELREQYQAAKDEALRIETANKEAAVLRHAIQGQIDIAKVQITTIDRRMRSKPVTPFGSDCAPCPLMQEFAGLEAKCAEFEGQIEKLKADLDAVPADQPMPDLTKLILQGERANAAAASVAKAEESRKEALRVGLLLEDAKQQLARIDADRPEEVASRASELEAIDTEMINLVGAADRLKAAQLAQSDADAKRAQLATVEESLKAAADAAAQAEAEASEARKALESRERARADARRCVEILAKELEKWRSTLEREVCAIGELTARITHLRERMEQQAQRRADLDRMRNYLAGLQDVRLALGPRGVRQILIDNAAPALEAIADQLFERATEGRMRLRIATQRVLADGSRSEDFQILVTDSRGERDALRYSGGQLQLIQILFRIAVALWVGQLRGQHPDCLFLDEAFDRLGAEGTADLLNVLDYLGDCLRLIVVVTHDQAIADRMASHVRLTRGALGATIVRQEVAA